MIAITQSELLDELRSSMRQEAPPNAMTVAEMAAALNIGETTIRNRLRKLRDAGRLEEYRVHRADVSGRSQTQPAYVLKPAPLPNADQRFKQDRKPSKRRPA